jgi:hypothetical protein
MTGEGVGGGKEREGATLKMGRSDAGDAWRESVPVNALSDFVADAISSAVIASPPLATMGDRRSISSAIAMPML